MPDVTGGSEQPAPADEFDREWRELTAGTAGKPLFIEPSAAERARGLRPALAASVKAERGRLGTALFLVVLLLVTGALAWAGYERSAPSAGPVPSPSAGPAPAQVPEHTGTISLIDPYAGPPADPFTGTKADHWANGAAGIVAPPAAAVGAYTAKQVAAAYAIARKMLIAANLDKQTLLGGPPTAFANLLTKRQRAEFLGGLNKTGVSQDGHALGTRDWVASFAPGSAELIGSVIKVQGTMSARTVVESGAVVLAVDVNYLFGYAVQSPHDPSDWTRVTDRAHGSIDFARWDDPAGALEPWDRATTGNANASSQCGMNDGYIHPEFPSIRSVDVRQYHSVLDPYSRGTHLHSGGTTCGRTTGT